MDGVLVVNKPAGPTSHDVVAAARRLLGESRIGHTGTLDPLATGVLPLACGRATRLVRFLVGSDKEYQAVIRFGLTTDSYDITGRETGRSDTRPSREAVLAALEAMQGDSLQTPPAFSAKQLAGVRAYDLARQARAPVLAPVPVRLARAVLTEFSRDQAQVSLTCSAGYYVRAFVHELGERLGVGACLEALCRTRSGDFRLSDAVTLDRLHGGDIPVVPLGALLPHIPGVTVTVEGRQRVSHGRALEPSFCASPVPDTEWVRLLDEQGGLIAMGRPGAGGALHPEVVLI